MRNAYCLMRNGCGCYRFLIINESIDAMLVPSGRFQHCPFCPFVLLSKKAQDFCPDGHYALRIVLIRLANQNRLI